MKLFLKSLKGDKQEIEADLQDTVLSLKERIKEMQGHDPSLQKLISAGQIMDDGRKLCDYSIKENDSLVLMVSKPKPQARPAAPANREEAGLEGGEPDRRPEAGQRVDEGTVQRAVEFLMAGMQGEGDMEDEVDDLPDDDYSDPLEDQLQQLLTDPSMQQLRNDILADPSILQTIAQQLQPANPALAQLITEHPEEIVEYLRGEGGEEIDPNLVSALPRPGRVEVTTEEMQAIRNLASLGFSEEDALEAYLSCDKN